MQSGKEKRAKDKAAIEAKRVIDEAAADKRASEEAAKRTSEEAAAAKRVSEEARMHKFSPHFRTHGGGVGCGSRGGSEIVGR